MRWWRRFRRTQAELEKDQLILEQEIRTHLELEMQENIQGGMTPEEARCSALRKFGNVQTVKETCREENRRTADMEGSDRRGEERPALRAG